MFKKLVGMTWIMLLSSIVLAGDQATERNGFYFKADVGASKMKNAKQVNKYQGERLGRIITIDAPNSKSKSKISLPINIAAGFYLNDSIRHDLSFGYQVVKFRTPDHTIQWSDDRAIIDREGKIGINRKATIYSLMFNSYVDFPINDQFQVFAGAGLGIAKINEKGNLKLTALNQTRIGKTIRSKKRQNFAYSLTTGISYKLNDNTNYELSYKWSDYGKTKFRDKDVTSNHYRGHSILTGIRYSM